MEKILYILGITISFFGLFSFGFESTAIPGLFTILSGLALFYSGRKFNNLNKVKNDIQEKYNDTTLELDRAQKAVTYMRDQVKDTVSETEIPEIETMVDGIVAGQAEVLAKEASEKILALELELQQLKEVNNLTTDALPSLQQERIALEETVSRLQEESKQLAKTVSIYNDDVEMIEFGLYSPVYELKNSELYKFRLEEIRSQQKQMIKDDIAVSYPTNITYNQSLSQGKKIIKDNVKQILRSFNNETEVLINKVKFNNVENYRNRVIKSYEQLNKLNSRLDISISPDYLNSKLEELTLSYEYALKKQEEKERLREEKERIREENKVKKEIEERRKELKKEEQHYKSALDKIYEQLKKDPNNPNLLAKKKELEDNLVEVSKGIADVDYREANNRAGYVYIISNIGSFGENIYKIGMTRRLEPMERVNELGDASVPFKFDVHAMIFSDDAPALENALHHAFEDRRVNMVNSRREFFNVTLEEIEAVVKENFKERTVEFTRVPEAEQFRESEKMKAQ